MQEDESVDETPQSSEPLSSEPLRDLPNSAIDIPVAVRETPLPPPSAQLKPTPLLWGAGGAIVLLTAGLALTLRPAPTPPAAPTQAAPTQVESNPAALASAQPTSTPTTPPDTLLGHYSYEEVPKDELVPILPDGSMVMQKAAAEKFMAMQEAARAAGVALVPISAFRSVQDQERVFFDVKAERGQDTQTRSEVSAPPGHSEHHTGYAVDIGDGDRPDLNLQTAFETSRAFQWLTENAGFYSFELSFPKDNSKGVSYEPWHWRFVGDRKSLETFYRARTSTPQKPK